MKAVRRISGSILSVLFLLPMWSAPAGAQATLTPEQMSLRIERLTETNARIEEVLVGMRDQMKQLNDDVDRQGRLIDNRAMLDMIQQVDTLADEMSQLNGLIEQQVFQIDEIKKRQRELYLDIDRRLRDVESRTVTQAPAPSIDIPQTPSTTSSETTATVGQTSTPETTMPSLSGSETSTASLSTGSSAIQSEERAVYQAAFDTLKEGRYKKAKTQFKTFLDKYPNSSFSIH